MLLFLLGFSVLLKSQIKPHLRLEPRLFTEREKPFSRKRSADFNARFNKGIGFDAELLFSKKTNPSSKYYCLFGPAVGQYLFWNNQVKNVDYAFPYYENNLVSPFMFCFKYSSFNPLFFRTPKAHFITLEFRAGSAYIQSEITSVNTGFTKIYSRWAATFSAYICAGKCFKLGRGFFLPIVCSIGYVNLGGKHLTGLFAI